MIGPKKLIRRNKLCVVSPLENLYPETVTFQVVFEDSSKNLDAKVNLKSSLCLNETKWLVLDMKNSEMQHLARTNNDVAMIPTMFLELTFYGPYRPMIANIVQITKKWFGIVDRVTAVLSNISFPFPLLSSRYLLLPLVPLLAIALVTSPILMGVSIMLLPFMLPIMVILGTIFSIFILALMILLMSTRRGRNITYEFTSPFYLTVSQSALGQRLLFDTGPIFLMTSNQTIICKLILSLVIDFIGSCSYIVPGTGELTDIIWAPIQTMIIISMYDSTNPSLKYVSFIEELLPFTDIVPTGTIGWIVEYGSYLLNGSFHSNSRKNYFAIGKGKQNAVIKQL